MQTATMTDLDQYYTTVQRKGHILTRDLAEQWSAAVLKSLGMNLGRGAKKKLANALPPELADDLTRVFWLLHFRDTNMPAYDFQKIVARRAGHTDPQYALHPITGVFHALKQLVDGNVSDAVAESLSPELRALWQNA